MLLNFPNNPTGYTPNKEEADGIVSALYEAAEAGINIVTLLDDAYFGLFYEDSVKESLFAQLAGLHSRILPIKIDGATKENYVWGLRVGFITYAAESEDVLHALEEKTKGIIRGAISSAPHLSTNNHLQFLQSEDFAREKKKNLISWQKQEKRNKFYKTKNLTRIGHTIHLTLDTPCVDS